MENQQPLIISRAAADEEFDNLNNIIIPQVNNNNNNNNEVGGDIKPINGVCDFFKEFYYESKKLWYLAAPAIFNGVCQYGIGTITSIFAGHIGSLQLAALSMTTAVVAAFGFGILTGLGSALETLCGQAYGANQIGMLGIYLQRSWVILNAAVLPILLFFIFASPLLKLLGQKPKIAEATGKFALWMIPQQFAYAFTIPLSKFLQSQSRVIVLAAIAGIAVSLHLFTTWLTIVKLGWGLTGAALGLNTTWWFITLAQFFYVISGFCGRAWSGFSWSALHNLTEFVKLSVSSAIMNCLEYWYNTAITLVAGLLKDAADSVDAITICLMIGGLCSMIGMGLGVAISVRVANELGLRHPRAARLSVIVALVTALFIGLLISIILFIERSRYPALFSSSPEIQKLVEQLTPSLGLCIVLTCLQGPLYGIVTGAGWQKFIALLNSLAYLIFGIPLGVLMCFKFHMGVKGLYYGMVIGIALQTMAVLLVICFTNWKKEASSAEERLRLWGGEPLVEDVEEKESF